ncbi:MAG TPA: transglycosylase domain-containing protein [Gemmatimonadales bacterium]|nr:transglycosylase domain-containing protein [Gemmatimonadales bacterium]
MKRILRGALKAVLIGGGLFVLWLVAVWPPPVWYRTHWPSETAFQGMRRWMGGSADGRIDTRDELRAELVTSWGGAVRPSAHPPIRLYHPVSLDSIAKWVPQAVMAGEDQRFRDHGGIDWVNLRRALGYPRDGFAWGVARDRSDLRKALGRAWERRSALRGASTLTQQLAKNLYLSPSRNPLRKVKEAVTAYRLEAALGKDRILELYLNVAELGPEIWGVEAASRYYFDRPAARLSLDQAAAIAGMLPFPLRSNPAFRPGRMQYRQHLILRLLRGEEVEVPPVAEEEAAPPPSDSLPSDSLPVAPVDSVVTPVDSAPPTSDSLPDGVPDSVPPAPDTMPGKDSSGAGRP